MMVAKTKAALPKGFEAAVGWFLVLVEAIADPSKLAPIAALLEELRTSAAAATAQAQQLADREAALKPREDALAAKEADLVERERAAADTKERAEKLEADLKARLANMQRALEEEKGTADAG